MYHRENTALLFPTGLNSNWCHWLSSKRSHTDFLLYLNITCIIYGVANKFCGIDLAVSHLSKIVWSHAVCKFLRSQWQSPRGETVPEAGDSTEAGKKAQGWHNHHRCNELSTGATITVSAGDICSMTHQQGRGDLLYICVSVLLNSEFICCVH